MQSRANGMSRERSGEEGVNCPIKVFTVSAKKLMRKKSKKNKQTLEELNSAHHRSQAECQKVVVTKHPTKIFAHQVNARSSALYFFEFSNRCTRLKCMTWHARA